MTDGSRSSHGKSTEEHLAVGDPLWTEGKPIDRFSVLAEGTVESSRTSMV